MLIYSSFRLIFQSIYFSAKKEKFVFILVALLFSFDENFFAF